MRIEIVSEIFFKRQGVLERVICMVIFIVNILIQSITCVVASQNQDIMNLGLTDTDFQKGVIPAGWHLRSGFWRKGEYSAIWVEKDDEKAVKLHSQNGLCFLEKEVDIDIKAFPIVSWKWRVENILQNIDERTVAGDDHPIRIFFVFEPDKTKQSFWFRLKRFLYLDAAHGHAMGGRFTEYLWSSHLKKGEIIKDPKKPRQKLMVVEGGAENVGKWLVYEKNLYEDFKRLYNEEPRRLIFIGILNDTDATGLEATSYIADLEFKTR